MRSRQAIVIGPTPPGTGVIAPATSLTASKSTSPQSTAVDAVHADVDHGRAGLDPVGADHPRAADGGDQDVGAAADLGEVARARVADGDRRVGSEQQLRHRLAEQVRAADHDGLGALERRAGLREQQHHAGRRARPQAVAAQRERAGAERRQAVDVLERVDEAGQLDAVEVVRDRELADDAADLRVGVELLDQRDDLVARRVGGEPVVEAPDADLGAGLLLAADVDGARRVVADEDRREARRASVLARKASASRATCARTRPPPPCRR